MLISYDDMLKFFKTKCLGNLSFPELLTGVFHIGAHECEELSIYNRLGIDDNDIIWVDAMEDKVIQAKNKGINNIYQAVVSDKTGDKVNFNITNNGQSSSILEFGTHATNYPTVTVIDSIEIETITVNDLIDNNNIDMRGKNFWNFDIQGVELKALKGAYNYINYADIIYLEVNTEEVYKGCDNISDIDEYLYEYDFIRVLTSMTNEGWGDAMYIKREYIKNDINYNISFVAQGRTGNNIFQYIACKLLSKFYGHNYSINHDHDYIIIDDQLFNEIQKSDNPENDPKFAYLYYNNIICIGFFQFSDIYTKNRNYILNIFNNDNNDNNDCYLDGNKEIKQIKDITNHQSPYILNEDDLVISLRLEDFGKIGQVISPYYYIMLIDTIIFNRLIIVCNEPKEEWEINYLKFFSKYNPIYQHGIFEEDMSIIRDSKMLLHSNSTLCWINSFLGCDKMRYIPKLNSLNQKLSYIQDTDIILPLYELPWNIIKNFKPAMKIIYKLPNYENNKEINILSSILMYMNIRIYKKIENIIIFNQSITDIEESIYNNIITLNTSVNIYNEDDYNQENIMNRKYDMILFIGSNITNINYLLIDDKYQKNNVAILINNNHIENFIETKTIFMINS